MLFHLYYLSHLSKKGLSSAVSQRTSFCS